MPEPSSSSTAAGGISSPSVAGGAVGEVERPAQRRRVDIKNGDTNKIQKKLPKLAPTDLRSITGFTSKQRSYLVRAGFTTTQEVLFLPLQSLSERLKISSEEAKTYISAITAQRSQKWMNIGSVASQLALHDNGTTSIPASGALSTGDGELDNLLGGGIVPGTLTEIAGEASSGKTALSLQLALHVQLPLSSGGLAGSCAYLSSEGNFPSTRLVDIARSICGDDELEEVGRMTDNVHLIHCAEVEELLHAVRYSLPALVERLEHGTVGAEEGEDSHTQKGGEEVLRAERKPVKLVIVDSIAAPFRGSEASGPVDAPTTSFSNTYAERNAALHEIATSLHTLAGRHSLCVILINQVSDVFSSSSSNNDNAYGGGGNGEQGMTSSISHEDGGIPLDYRNYSTASRWFTGEDSGINGGKMAVFGLPWSNLVQSRVMLSRTGRRRQKHDGSNVGGENEEAEEMMGEIQTEEIRRANLVFSPFSDRGWTDYVLRQGGLVSTGPCEKQPRVVASWRNGGKGKGASEGADGMEDEDDEEALWEGYGTDGEILDE